jgi:hypothetical protein
MGHAGLAEVNLIIDHARQQIFASKVNDLRSLRCGNRCPDVDDSFTVYQYVHIPDFAFIDETGVA